jgi:hypothetical protein
MNLYLFDLRKIKLFYKNSDISSNQKEKENFNGFLDKPSNLTKDLVFKNKKTIPIIIVNPIFQNYENFSQLSLNEPEINVLNNVIDENSRNISPNNSFVNSKRNWNDKFIIGFIE